MKWLQYIKRKEQNGIVACKKGIEIFGVNKKKESFRKREWENVYFKKQNFTSYQEVSAAKISKNQPIKKRYVPTLKL